MGSLPDQKREIIHCLHFHPNASSSQRRSSQMPTLFMIREIVLRDRQRSRERLQKQPRCFHFSDRGWDCSGRINSLQIPLHTLDIPMECLDRYGLGVMGEKALSQELYADEISLLEADEKISREVAPSWPFCFSHLVMEGPREPCSVLDMA